MLANIHSIESMGTLDGPGLRYVVFFQGCPLRCQYCHNPDTLEVGVGKSWTLEALLDDVNSYIGYLTRGKGGVTVSGGEPLMQAEFVEAFLKGCKDMGLHTAMDTAGSLGSKASDALLEVTDLVLMDMKAGIPELYNRVTRGQMERQMAFAQRISDAGRPMWIRFVLVPGLTDPRENLEALADITLSLETVERFEVLPFHKLGEFKWKELGITNLLSDTPACSEEQAEEVRSFLRTRGVENVY
jgi:pyruvate formate lyase activating enzyme